MAVGDEVYVTLGLSANVAALDAATGEELREYAGTEHTEEILVADGVLYLVVGTSEANRMGGGLHLRGEPEAAPFRYVTAIEADTGKKLWKKEFGNDEFLLPLTLAVKGRDVLYQTTTGVGCLDAGTGDETYYMPLPSSQFVAGTYVIRVECYHQGRLLHVGHHQADMEIVR